VTIFQAFMVDRTEDGFSAEVREIGLDQLMQGELLIRVAYSSVNYKDGLASLPDSRIVRSYPMIPGIDLAGTVVSSEDPRYRTGDEVIVTSYGLGVSHYGGFCSYARVPAAWGVPLPKGLSMKEAMALGTAGFTAALSIQRLEEHGVEPGSGPILVTGASGGVGSLAVAILAKRGYHVVASSGKEAEYGFLSQIGAAEIIPRLELPEDPIPALAKQRWAGVVDPVGGKSLAYILSSLQYGGAAAVSGLTGGGEVPTTVYPFILRGVQLLGIDSVECPMEVRRKLWERIANEFKPEHLLDNISQEITLEQLPSRLTDIVAGQVRGRVIVRL
jgi:acrylyl-CoA reductase (NADPH)